MSPFMMYQPRTINDHSQLDEGWHPAALVAIDEEDANPLWDSVQKYQADNHTDAVPRMWRWKFALWDTVADLSSSVPEMASKVTSKKFSPGGRYQASTAYVWTKNLLNRPPQPGEAIDLWAMLPLACMVKVGRTNKDGELIEYANIENVRAWPEGQQHFPQAMKDRLANWYAMKNAQVYQPPSTPMTQTPMAEPPLAPAPPQPVSTTAPSW